MCEFNYELFSISVLSAYGNLTVRSLLDTIEHYLREFDFPDPFLLVSSTYVVHVTRLRDWKGDNEPHSVQQRQNENDAALTLLQSTIEELDGMETTKRHEELIKSFLAGNIFDWGAKEVAKILENQQFGFQQAREKIPGWYFGSLKTSRVELNYDVWKGV